MSLLSQPQRDAHVSVEEYLVFERASEERHEYHAGRIVAMAGASREHSQITRNFIRYLANKLADQETCEVFTSDLRVAITATRRYVYPDVTVVCGAAEWADDAFDMLLNPTLLIDVLSPSTELRDRGEKLFAYQMLPSLQDYLIVHQETARVEHFSRQGTAWLYRRSEGLDGLVDLPSLGLSLRLGEIYERVSFPTRPDEA